MQENLFLKRKPKIISYLQHCAKSNYYRDLFSTCGIDINKIQTYEDFKRIPILDKNTYKKHSFDILAPCYASLIDQKEFNKFGDDYISKKKYLLERGLYIKVTSGSTGIPLEIIKSNSDINRDYIMLNRLRKKILGSLPNGKFVWIWPVTQYISKHFYFENDEKDFYKVNEHGFQYFVTEISNEIFYKLYCFMKEKNISWITCTPSFIYEFSIYIHKNGLSLFLEYIECHSEKLFSWQKEFITQVFQTVPFNVYSTNEVQFMGMTCQFNQMHIHPNVFIEICKDDEGMNEVLVTSLNNFDTPFLRYRIGDRAQWQTNECQCMFSNYSILNISEYRTNDFIIDGAGKKYEAYIITDSITLAASNLGINIARYKVFQVDYYKFTYYIDFIFNNKIKQQFIKYLQKYFYDIFNHDKIYIEINDYKNLKFNDVSKFKYFENIIQNGD